MPTWNHPRIRGDTGLAHDAMRATSGSSPHTRGTPSQGRPAASAARDHPRIRGEHRYPHMMPALVGGIIPAYAGNTSRESCDRARRLGSSPHTRGTLPPTFPQPLYRRDHPRIRGDTQRLQGRHRRVRGSSPHTRGTLTRVQASSRQARDHPRIRGEHCPGPIPRRGYIGIIPAYAGNTLQNDLPVLLEQGSSPHTRGTPRANRATGRGGWDHPRIRGEHYHQRFLNHYIAGIIPAYAGNTFIRPFLMPSTMGSSPHTRGTPMTSKENGIWARDHPRIRGEHYLEIAFTLDKRGIIPAYAGNTPFFGSLNVFKGDHPRIHGEHWTGRRSTPPPHGIIPAYAGNTSGKISWNAYNKGSSPHTRGTLTTAACSSRHGLDHPRIRGEHVHG